MKTIYSTKECPIAFQPRLWFFFPRFCDKKDQGYLKQASIHRIMLTQFMVPVNTEILCMNIMEKFEDYLGKYQTIYENHIIMKLYKAIVVHFKNV